MFNPIQVGKNLLNAKKQYDEFRKKLQEVKVVGESRKGLVKVHINGLKEVVDVFVSDELLIDKAELQRHIKEAVNDAGKRLEKDVLKYMNDPDTMNILKTLLGS